MQTMHVARMHKIGEPMVLERIPRPTAGCGDVVVAVAACGLVPNLANVLRMWDQWFPYLPLPKLPSSFGLDVAGTITDIDDPAGNFRIGERVYVSPGLSCGSCDSCQANEPINCRDFTFRGYFGFAANSQSLYDRYPHGGFGEYISAPIQNLVRLPENVCFEAGARMGYLGTAYASLRKLRAGPGKSVLVNGITGTLGLGACLLALAMGVTRILGTGRNSDLIKKVEALAPGRISILRFGEGSIADFARLQTRGNGVDGVVDCLAPGADGTLMMDAIRGIRRGGAMVNVNGIGEPVMLDVKWMQAHQVALIGNNWFTTEEGQHVADMAGSGQLDLSILKHIRFALSDINNAISELHDRRDGGFSNFVVIP